MKLSVFILLSSGCLCLAACGRTDLEVFGGTGGVAGLGGHDGGVDAVAGRAGGTGGVIGGAGGAPGSGGRVGTGGTPGTGGRVGTGGVVGTGGTPPPPDGGAPDLRRDGPQADAGPVLPPSTPGVLVCGAQSCNTQTQACCVSVAVGAVGATCVPAGTACPGASLGCDEPADCAATGVCCFGLQARAGGVSVGSSCTSRNACGGFGRFVVCRQNGDCAAATPFCCNSLGVPTCQAARCP